MPTSTSRKSRRSKRASQRTSVLDRPHPLSSSARTSTSMTSFDTNTLGHKHTTVIRISQDGSSADIAELRSCIACATDKPTRRGFHRRITDQCTHESNTCKACVRAWIRSQLDERSWDVIKCPECPQIMQYQDMAKRAGERMFQKYDKIATRAALSAIPDFQWCLNPKCSSGQIHDPSTSATQFRCVACGFEACLKHQEKWHDGLSCKEYDYISKYTKSKKVMDEAASERWKGKKTKKCPTCGIIIEKNGGCDTMWCKKCDFYFMWKETSWYKPPKRYGKGDNPRAAYHAYLWGRHAISSASRKIGLKRALNGVDECAA